MRFRVFAMATFLTVLTSDCSLGHSDDAALPSVTTAPPLSHPQPARGGFQGVGSIAYSFEGRIYVGDLSSGETTLIVPGPDSHTNPIFSPDGRFIALVRGDPYLNPTIVVVRADGSDERVVVPEGFIVGAMGPFAWTPDGTSIVVQCGRLLDAPDLFDGLVLFDVAGERDPVVLSPRLPNSRGGIYFNPNAQVAPMFRPPEGDLILSGLEWNTLETVDSDLAASAALAAEALEPFEDYLISDPTWSPDGSMIVFFLDQYADRRRYLGSGLFVVNADGTDLRSIGAGRDPLWSPDGSRIAYQRLVAEDSTYPADLVVFDVDSGTGRGLVSTEAPPKHSTEYHTITHNTYHTWYYEAWSWSPDGQSLLVLERHRTRPYVVDLDTGAVSEIPWVTDSAPSWTIGPSA